MDFNITILGQAIAFFMFVLFCMKYLWPPIISVIEKRQKEISDMFYSIEKEKKMVETIRIEASNHLEKAKIEAKLIVMRANQYKIQLIEQAKHDAESERKDILLRAHEEINVKRKCVSEELQREIHSMIILGIEKILKRSIDTCVHHDVINASLKDLS